VAGPYEYPPGGWCAQAARVRLSTRHDAESFLSSDGKKVIEDWVAGSSNRPDLQAPITRKNKEVSS
jgi:hypothetical protein